MKNNEKVVYLTDYIENDQEISTITPHNKVEHAHGPDTHLTKRIIAFGIDLASIMIVKTSLHTAYAIFINQFFSPINGHQRAQIIQGSLRCHALTFIAIYTSYFLYTSFILDGKTLGKMTMGLRVIDEGFIQDHNQEEYRMTFQNSIRRSIGYLMCYLSFGTFFIFNFSSEDKRGLPDYLSNSRTVSDDRLKSMLEKKQYEAETVSIDIRSLDVAKSA